jgi:hypothetical protein
MVANGATCVVMLLLGDVPLDRGVRLCRGYPPTFMIGAPTWRKPAGTRKKSIPERQSEKSKTAQRSCGPRLRPNRRIGYSILR